MNKKAQAQPILGGRYQVLRQLGVGGMAEVLQARDLTLQRDVAIKILKDDLIHDPSFRANFLQEGRAAANLSHPNIITIYDFGHDQGRYFIVMEYVEGTDLKTILRARGVLPAEEAINLLIQVCSGCGYAHRAGLVHCDLKPHNILVTADGRAKITDFGIARALASISPDETSDVVWGTPEYFSPEQAAGLPPSPASDVYSLGIILYEMLTGHLPFLAADPLVLADLHQATPPPSPRKYEPSIPEPLEELVLKLLAKEPSGRYRNADQLGRVLMTFSKQFSFDASRPIFDEHLPEDKPAEGTPSPRVDWLAVGLALAASLALGGLIPLWLWVCMLYPSCPLALR